ncbi:MAG: hypothetical protein MPJ05_04520 [Nitrosopumilus sp.]|nr:hypothetical protein [Nitrosopumilus sp.]
MKAAVAAVAVAASIAALFAPGAAHADTHLPITVTGALDLYAVGSEIEFDVKLRNYKSNDTLKAPPVVRLLAPDTATGTAGNVLNIIQVLPSDINSEGVFTISMKAGGPLWKETGSYKVLITYDGQESVQTFSYTSPLAAPAPEPVLECPDGQILRGGECVDDIPEPPPPPPPPPPPECPAGQILENGQCVDEPPPPPPTCPTGQSLVDGRCVDDAPPQPECGPGTILQNGICVIDPASAPAPAPAQPGCLIATAAYGTELAPQVQMLREIRDGTVLTTESGSSFMGWFNDVYYSFSPAVADLQREHPVFREAVRVLITPMIHSLSIMSLSDGSESQVLALGIAVIALNAGMYVAAPATAAVLVRRHAWPRGQ